MDPNATTVYYTFSTIAQTVAAIVAILAAFAVVRLSDLATRLRDQLGSLAHYCQYPEVFYASLAEGDYEGALKQISEDVVGDDHIVMGVCAKTESERKGILSALRLNFVIAGGVVAISVTVLIFAELFSSVRALVWTVLILGLISLIVCLVAVGRLVTKLAPGRLHRTPRSRKIAAKKVSGFGTPNSKGSGAGAQAPPMRDDSAKTLR